MIQVRARVRAVGGRGESGARPASGPSSVLDVWPAALPTYTAMESIAPAPARSAIPNRSCVLWSVKCSFSVPENVVALAAVLLPTLPCVSCG